MIVSMWMTRDPVTVEPGTSIVEAAALMTAKSVRRLPVVVAHPEGPHLQGIIAASDLRRVFPANVNPFGLLREAFQTDLTAAQIMAREVFTTTAETPIEDAARLMRDRKVGALPVVRGENTLIGLITESDIFRAFVGMFESREGGARISFDVPRGEDIVRLLAQMAQQRSIRVLSVFWSQRHEQPVCVVRIAGEAVDSFVDELRHSGHRILNVLRFP
jgi:acetoin utilization protein AcuB